MSAKNDEHLHAGHPDPHHDHSIKLYVIVFAALMVLLVITLLAAQVDFHNYLPGHFWNLAIAGLIASVKGALIVLFFMHVKTGHKRIWIFASAGFLWLGLLFVLLFADYLSRRTPGIMEPRGEPRYLAPADHTNPVHHAQDPGPHKAS